MAGFEQSGKDIADALNRNCFCLTVNRQALRHQLLSAEPDADLYEQIETTRPHLFSDTAVFVSPEHQQQMRRLIRAIEEVVALPRYQQHVLAEAPALSQRDHGPLGACMGYDFHLGPDGPRLIEINTNAGGAWLNAALSVAQIACCGQPTAIRPTALSQADFEQQFLAMFLNEWRLQRGDSALKTVAIVDSDPSDQYLGPEFILVARMFERHGIRAVIADPRALNYADGVLVHDQTPIELVYNRLTDFALANPEHAALRDACQDGTVVMTPAPRHHALYADKRNLAVLTDEALLRGWGIDQSLIDTLIEGIPRTVVVTEGNADQLWSHRRQLFFKPAAGYGSKATYRGDKLTRRVWGEILAADYVAQQRVVPSERGVLVDGQPSTLKLDLRSYVYAGQVQLFAARLYQGQTTNFRTPGGGFAAVLG